MKEFWNNRFGASRTEYIYGTAPNVFFARELQKLEPGKLLLPAEGEGRNAVFAAGLGWQVTAFDISEAGREKAMQLARELGVEDAITYHIDDFDSFAATDGSFDALGLSYAHVSSSNRRRIHRKLTGMLRPGGKVILEAFSKKQLGRDSGGPKDERMLYDEADIRVDFESLREISVLRQEVELEEGEHHRGPASVIRLTGLA